MGSIRKIDSYYGKGPQDPFGPQVYFYAQFNTNTTVLTGQTINATSGTPLIQNTAPLAFTDSLNYLNPNGGFITYNWTPAPFMYPVSWTMECWGYLTSYAAGGRCVFSSNSFGSLLFRIQVGPAGELDFTTDAGTVTSAGGVVTLNAWHHLAVAYTEGVSIEGYVDGVRRTGPGAAGVLGNKGGPATLRVGANALGIANWVGKIGPVRVTAARRYSGASFTPPTLLPQYP